MPDETIEVWTEANYRKYLKSAHWQEVKARHRARHTDCCYACDAPGPTHLHHKTYKRLGRERLSDLVQLCPTCHLKVHQVLQQRGSQKTNLFNVARKLRKMIKKWGKEKALRDW